MTADPHAAAHGEPLQEGDDGLGIGEDLGVQPVFICPELAPVGVVSLGACGVKFGDVTARAKGTIPFGVKDDQIDVRVMLPSVEGVFDGQTHVVGHGVQRLGAGEGDPSRAP